MADQRTMDGDGKDGVVGSEPVAAERATRPGGAGERAAPVDPSIPPSAYRIRIEDDPSRIDAPAWDRLVDARSLAGPFMRHAFLAALHESGSACTRTGWRPQFVLVHEGEELVAACPLWAKSHSYGEYVFDWAWADAYQRHGLRYYPKLLGAVPFSPVPGPRLLAHTPAHRRVLLRVLSTLVQDTGLSSVHLLFLDPEDRDAIEQVIAEAPAAAPGWMLRTHVQFHWHNRRPAPWGDFTAFLADLQREKRKKIQQERRRVAEAGVTLECLEGPSIATEDWDFFHRCYTLTYQAHHSTPYLNRDFFARMQATMSANWMMVVARRQGVRVAASLIAIDRDRGAAWGRHWGATEPIACLHFEACYYQPLEWCIAQGFERFEGGAQGEHKMARGLLPVPTVSAHWLAHPQFAQAVADFLEREGAGVEGYLDELQERRPFKSGRQAPLPEGPDAFSGS